MRAQVRARLIVVSALIAGALAVSLAGANTKPRSVLILPFAPADLGREEQWLGEALAQSLMLALTQVPSLVQIDRDRLKQVTQPDVWDEQSAAAAAKALHADIAIYGEVRRNGPEIAIQPRYVEMKGDRPERVALDVLTVPDGALMDRLKTLSVAYVKALKLSLSESELARVQKWASPTTSARAFEPYVRGRIAAYRGNQEGNEAAVDLLGKAAEIDPQFVATQFALGAVHQTLGNRWKAAAQFRASTQLDPTYPEPYKSLGDLFLTAPRRLFDQAIEAYAKAIEIRPFYAEAYVGLGDAKAAKSDVDGAVAAYQKALAFNPVNAKVHVSLGQALLHGEGSLLRVGPGLQEGHRPRPPLSRSPPRAGRGVRGQGALSGGHRRVQEGGRRRRQEHRSPLQPGACLREGRPQRGDHPLGALHPARRLPAFREGLGRRRPAPPAKAEEPTRQGQLSSGGSGPPATIRHQ